MLATIRQPTNGLNAIIVSVIQSPINYNWWKFQRLLMKRMPTVSKLLV